MITDPEKLQRLVQTVSVTSWRIILSKTTVYAGIAAGNMNNKNQGEFRP